MKVLDLFSGIGGFSLGLERAGMETVAFCECEPYAQKVLKKHWPDVPIFEDVRALDGNQFRGAVDVICGGFPCQDISTAGKQEGISEGTRSGLWSECARLLGEVRPKYAIFENVTNLLNGQRGDWFKRVLWDISAVGYDAEWHCIPASSIGAPHERDRVWIIAYSNSELLRVKQESRQERKNKAVPSDYGSERSLANTKRKAKKALISQRLHTLLQEQNSKRAAERFGDENGFIGGLWAVEPCLGRVADGVSYRSHRLGCLGNAVVPQIPEIIGRAIMEVDA